MNLLSSGTHQCLPVVVVVVVTFPSPLEVIEQPFLRSQQNLQRCVVVVVVGGGMAAAAITIAAAGRTTTSIIILPAIIIIIRVILIMGLDIFFFVAEEENDLPLRHGLYFRSRPCLLLRAGFFKGRVAALGFNIWSVRRRWRLRRKKFVDRRSVP